VTETVQGVTEASGASFHVKHAVGSTGCEALLIGGRSGVGKSTVAWEVSAQLQDCAQLRDGPVAHCLIEGDFLDQAYPPPEGDPTRRKLTEDNLTALWRNFAALGYWRLIYTNTVSILESDLIVRAMGGNPRITAVLLTSTDETAGVRLSAREIGSQLDAHVHRSSAMARQLDKAAPSSVVRVPTDDRDVISIARDVVAATGWVAQPGLKR
jgi:hypothetical protein